MKTTTEELVLKNVNQMIKKALVKVPKNQHHEAIFQLLECVSSIHSGIAFKDVTYLKKRKLIFKVDSLKVISEDIYIGIVKSGIEIPIALSALLGPALDWHQKKSTGSYYTDFRLAKFLASQIGDAATSRSKVIDPACGSGILLAAFVLNLFPTKSKKRDKFLATNVFGSDMSARALRSAFIALSSMASETKTLKDLRENFVAVDSLKSPDRLLELSKNGFDYVIGNPPWEKLKTNIYEELKKLDPDAVYGSESNYSKKDKKFELKKEELEKYVQDLKSGYSYQGKGEADLYKFFLELSHKILKKDGNLSLIIPGGFVRSQGSQQLRELVFKNSNSTKIHFFDNRGKFFAIDSRFKFLILQVQHSKISENSINISFPAVSDAGIAATPSIEFAVRELEKLRNDLSIPEVRNENELQLFRKLVKEGVAMKDNSCLWKPKFSREVDMTSDKEFFSKSKKDLPLIEGRMVHQFTHNAKLYRSGSGRSAVWEDNFFTKNGKLETQFYFPKSKLSKDVLERIKQRRVGFCDITGQTNERTFLASWVPSNVVCGNKVPTIIFEGDNDYLSNLWLGITNSFVFDWLLRRVVTTTVNYFILTSIPLPNIAKVDKKVLHGLCKTVEDLSGNVYSNLEDYQDKRAEIEAIVARMYGLSFEELDLVLQDFPLVDRAFKSTYPTVESSITKDLVKEKFLRLENQRVDETIKSNLVFAKENYIFAFLPSQSSYEEDQAISCKESVL